MYTYAVITASDKGSRGEREDLSGKVIIEIMEAKGYELKSAQIIEDDKSKIKNAMIELADKDQVALILTTGGTGFSLRDVTPEATLEVVDRLTPGICEATRAYSLQITKRAMLSRATSGIRKKTLIVNLPGSPKAVRESLDYIVDELKHGLDILWGNDGECAR